jgi:hypothetical protein
MITKSRRTIVGVECVCDWAGFASCCTAENEASLERGCPCRKWCPLRKIMWRTRKVAMTCLPFWNTHQPRVQHVSVFGIDQGSLIRRGANALCGGGACVGDGVSAGQMCGQPISHRASNNDELLGDLQWIKSRWWYEMRSRSQMAMLGRYGWERICGFNTSWQNSQPRVVRRLCKDYARATDIK